MKTNIYILTLLSLFFIVSCKDDDSTGTIDIIDPVDPVDPVFVYVDPNINDGVIDFEEFGPSFEQDTKEDAEDQMVGIGVNLVERTKLKYLSSMLKTLIKANQILQIRC